MEKARSDFAKRLLRLMSEAKMQVRDLARKADVAESTIYLYISDKRKNPSIKQVIAIARALSVTPNELLGMDAPESPALREAVPVGDFVLLPVVGTVRAGPGGIAEEHIEEYRHVPKTHIPEGAEADCFLLVARGDSMVDAGIHEGDTILVCTSVSVREGDIAVVDVDGEAMIKRVYHRPAAVGEPVANGQVLLVSDNSAFPPMIVPEARIVGRAMKCTRDL